MALLQLADRIKETSITTGTGTFTLLGAGTGFRSFSTFADADTVYYVIEAVDGSGVPTGQWEVGIGTVGGVGTTLARTTLISSSTGSAINFSAGTKNVFCDQPSSAILVNALVNGATTVLWNQHDPTVLGTVGIAVGNVGGFTFGSTFQPVRFTSGPGGEPIYIDDTWHIGQNVGTLSGGVGRANTAKPNLVLSFESKFHNGSEFGQEFHLQGVSTDGLTTFRPMSFFIAHDVASVGVTFAVDSFIVNDKAGGNLFNVNDANNSMDLTGTLLRFATNNVPAIQQKNSSGSMINLLYLNASNVAYMSTPLAVESARMGSIFANFTPTTASTNDEGIVVSIPTFTGNFTGLRCSGSVTGIVTNKIANDAAAAGAHTRFQLATSGASGGDPYIFFDINGVSNWSMGLDNSDSDKFKLATTSVLNGTGEIIVIAAAGQVGFGVNAPTAVVHLKAGTATASTAPLKFTSGTNLTTAEAGAMEYNGANLFFTRAGTVREGVITQSAVTTEVIVADTSVTINIGGATYKLLARA